MRTSLSLILSVLIPGQAWPQVYTGNERGQNGIFSGYLRMGTTTDTTSGNIRWTGTDFEGYTGAGWSSFTAGGAGWTDSGALVRTTTLTDQIGIGTTDPLAIDSGAILFASQEPRVEFLTGTTAGTFEDLLVIRHAEMANTAVWRRLGLLFKFDYEGGGNWKGAGIVVDTDEVWANNPKLHLITDNFKRLTVDIDGQVGVGTTAPADRFQVWSTSFSVSDVHGVAIGEDPGAGNFDAGGHGDLSLYGPNGTGSGAAIYFGDNYSTDPTNLAIGESGGTDTDKLNIHSKEGLDITIGNTATWEGGTPVVVLENNGEFGVGVTAPTATLHVSSGASSGTTEVFRVSSGTANSGQELFKVQANGDVTIETPGSVRMGLYYRNYNATSANLRCACTGGGVALAGGCSSGLATAHLDSFPCTNTTDGTSAGTAVSNNATTAACWSCEFNVSDSSNRCFVTCARMGN